MASHQQMLLPLVPETLKTFALFLPGKNQLVLETLASNTAPQFIYLFGAKGTGKTHLLEAYAAAALEQQKHLLFLPLKNLPNATDYLKDLPKFDAILMDDLDYLTSDLEINLFNLFNELQAQGTPLIVTSTVPPAALNLNLPDLKSRLNSGLSLKLEPLKDEELKAALKLHCKHIGLQLNDKIYDFILNRSERNLDILIKQLKQVADHSLLTRRPVTLMMAKKVLSL